MLEENTSKPRRRNTKERIIDEAEVLAAFHGIEHLKLQDVADKIGIKLPSVYAHFSGREDILHAMSARIHRAMTHLFIHKQQDDPRDSLRRGADELVKLMFGHPSYFRLMLRDLSVPLGYDPINRRYSSHHGQAIAPELKDLIERVRKQLDMITTPGESKIVAESFVATILGAVLINLSWQEFNPNLPAQDAEMESLRQQIAELTNTLLSRARPIQRSPDATDKRS